MVPVFNIRFEIINGNIMQRNREFETFWDHKIRIYDDSLSIINRMRSFKRSCSPMTFRMDLAHPNHPDINAYLTSAPCAKKCSGVFVHEIVCLRPHRCMAMEENDDPNRV